MIRVTFLGHSGFLVEWPEQYWLFDYYTGAIPPLKPEKPLVVFVSHRHGDHCNGAVFRIDHPQVSYILSRDIRLTEKKRSEWGVAPEAEILPIRRRETLEHRGLVIRALPSTDEGVAFDIDYQGHRIYHAGDLNWWAWSGESATYNHNMEANFKRFIAPLEGAKLDLVFAPLDPRQEGDYALGLSYLLEHVAQARYVFPMHMWENYSVIDDFRRDYPQLSKNLLTITTPGQSWELEI